MSIDSHIIGMFERLERMFTRGLARLLVRVERQVAEMVTQHLYQPLGPWMRRDAAAKYLSVSTSTLDYKVAAGHVRCAQPPQGGYPLFCAKWLDEYAQNVSSDTEAIAVQADREADDE